MLSIVGCLCVMRGRSHVPQQHILVHQMRWWGFVMLSPKNRYLEPSKARTSGWTLTVQTLEDNRSLDVARERTYPCDEKIDFPTSLLD